MFSKYSVRKPYTVLVGVIIVIVLGVVALMKMTADLLPDMSFPYVLVMTMNVGASPEEIEATITAPMEASMATTSNIKNISSMSNNSYSVVILEYEQSTNMDSTLIEIQQNIDQIEGRLPDSAGTPMVMQIDPDMMPIMMAAVGVDDMDSTTVATYVDNEIIPRLESVNGVASVSATGGVTERVEVTINNDKITKLNDKVMGEIDKKFADAQAEMDDAERQIKNGQKSLEDGKNALVDQTSSAKVELENQKIQLYQTDKDLDAQLASLEGNAKNLQDAIAGLNTAYEGAVKLQEGIDGLQKIIDLVDSGMLPPELFAQQAGMELEDARAQLEALKGQMAALNAQLAEQGKAFASMGVKLETYTDIPAAVGVLTNNLAQINVGIQTVKSAKEQIKSGQSTIDDALIQINKTEILSSIQMAAASAQLTSGQSALDDAKNTVKDSKEQAYDAADLNNVLTVDTVKNLLIAQNFDMPAGYVDEENTEYLIKVGDTVDDVHTLENVVLIDLGMDDIEPIKLKDVADVEVLDDSADIYAKLNGVPAVLLTFEKQTGFATGDVSDEILERFKEIEAEEPNVHLSVLMDQGVYIDMIVDSVLNNIIVGAILAIFILILFLKDVRPTIIIACAIPLSVVFAIVLMYFTNITLNIISMSGLALGIGMLVDNSIVVIENIYRLLGEGVPLKKACIEGASQVTGAIIASTLTTVCVFAPIIFTEGITRQLFVDMALTIAYTLLASLIVALTLVPAMASGMLKKNKEKKDKLFHAIQEGYGKVVAVALKLKIVVILIVLVLAGASVYAALSKGTAFMPEMTSAAQMTISITSDEENPKTLDELEEMSDTLVERLLEIPEITTIGAMAGGGSTLSLTQGSNDSISMYVLIDENAKVSTKELTEKVEDASADLDCVVSVSAEMMDMSAMTGSGISINIKGRNMDTLQSLAMTVANMLEETEGLVDVDNGLDNMTKELVISVDKQKAAEYKLTVAQVFQLVYAKMASTTSTTTISTDIKDFEVFVKSQEQEEINLDDLKKMTFTYTNSDGEEEEVPLKEIVTFKEKEELSTIRRDAQTRYITVSAGLAEGYNVGLVGDDIQKKIDEMDIPAGYAVTMSGENEAINDAMEQLLLMLLLAVILIYLIMVAQFQSLLSPFIIMFTIPLAFTGGFFALYFTNSEVSVIAMIGFVLLAGIIVNNGIVMVDFINQMRATGMKKKEAIVYAAKTRLRPVLMTALTTIISMSTMALGMGSGAEMMQPMAIVSVGGLVYGTLLTLIVVPCIYDLLNREKNMMVDEFGDKVEPVGDVALVSGSAEFIEAAEETAKAQDTVLADAEAVIADAEAVLAGDHASENGISSESGNSEAGNGLS